jgi:hypothetical protein
METERKVFMLWFNDIAIRQGYFDGKFYLVVFILFIHSMVWEFLELCVFELAVEKMQSLQLFSQKFKPFNRLVGCIPLEC